MENTTMFGGSLWIWVIFIGFTVISWLISHQLKSRFQKYSKIPTANGMTGRDVVEKRFCGRDADRSLQSGE